MITKLELFESTKRKALWMVIMEERLLTVQDKGKVHLKTGHEGPGGK